MPEDFESMLRTGALAVAEATKPVAVDLVRARGDRRQRRKMVASVVVAIAVIAGGAATAVGGPPAEHRHPSPAISREGFSLRLSAPASYAFRVPNPVSFTIDDSAGARTVIVEINLGKTHYAVYRKAVVERFDQATGRWRNLRVTHTRSGWIASYPLRVGTGLTRQRLLVVLAVPFSAPNPFVLPPLAVVIRSGGEIVAEQRTSAAEAVELLGAWQGTTYSQIDRGQTREFAFTVHNPASVRYPVQLYFVAAFCRKAHGCSQAALGDQFQWLDGRIWQPAAASAYLINGASDGNGELLKTVLLPAHGSFMIRFRIIVSLTSPSFVGQLIVSATPDSSGLPGSAALYLAPALTTATFPIGIN
jgi:hypothetical protein